KNSKTPRIRPARSYRRKSRKPEARPSSDLLASAEPCRTRAGKVRLSVVSRRCAKPSRRVEYSGSAMSDTVGIGHPRQTDAFATSPTEADEVQWYGCAYRLMEATKKG